MYEKNCLNNQFVAHVRKTTHMAILQMHPSPKLDVTRLFQQVYALDPHVAIHTIHAHTLHSHDLEYFNLFLNTVKGPSCVLVCKEDNTFLSILRLLRTKSETTSFPCTLIGVKHFGKMLNPAAISVLTKEELQWSDVLEITQPPSQTVGSLEMYVQECTFICADEGMGE
jgi:hypothetical protein